jgi:molecular chaperone DnaK (HSP70)
VDVDDTAVQQMVAESVVHAVDDLAARRWVEAKLKAAETLTATRKAIAEVGGELEEEYRANIEAAARDVESALATEQAGEAGDLKQLQVSVAVLDEATKPLADFLMDKAMETVLRRRGLIQ